MDQRLTRVEHDARQPRLLMEADGPANTKTHERTKGAATAVQAMSGDSCPANRVDPDPMFSTSFGDDCTGPPASPCSEENTLVNNGAAAPKPCLTLVDAHNNSRRWLTSRRYDHYSDEDHFPPAAFLVLLDRRDKFENFSSTVYVSFFSSFRWTKKQQPPFWPRVIETKSGQNLVFGPGGSTGRLRACSY